MKNIPKTLFLIGFAAGCIISIYSFFQYPIDSMGSVFLPFLMLAFSLPIGLIGYCLGYVFKCIFIEHRFFNPKLIIMLIVIWPALQIVLITWLIISPNINNMTMNVSKMNSSQLHMTVDQLVNTPDNWSADTQYQLGAVLRNSRTSAATLEKIVNMNDDKLYQPLSSGFKILFNKSGDTSIMTLIVDHPQVTPEILTKIYPKANQKLKNEIEIREKNIQYEKNVSALDKNKTINTKLIKRP
jgi:hypothetical protein